jgi:hypothetical protein
LGEVVSEEKLKLGKQKAEMFLQGTEGGQSKEDPPSPEASARQGDET